MSQVQPYEIADGVATLLKSAVHGISFQRIYVPFWTGPEVEEVNQEAVTAIAGPKPTALIAPTIDKFSSLARDMMKEEIQVNVGVIQRLPAGTDPTTPEANAVIDPLVKLCRTIALSFGPESNVGTYARWAGTKYAPIYDTDWLKNLGVFFGLIIITFKQTPPLPAS